MVVSSVSPERCEMTAPKPASSAIRTASRVSVRVPIWFTFTRIALPAPFSMPSRRIAGLVTKRSSPTTCRRSPTALVSFVQVGQSSSARPSSMETTG